MKEIIYKGFLIRITFQGFFEIHADGQFMKFDSLYDCKRAIDYWTH